MTLSATDTGLIHRPDTNKGISLAVIYLRISQLFIFRFQGQFLFGIEMESIKIGQYCFDKN